MRYTRKYLLIAGKVTACEGLRAHKDNTHVEELANGLITIKAGCVESPSYIECGAGGIEAIYGECDPRRFIEVDPESNVGLFSKDEKNAVWYPQVTKKRYTSGGNLL